MNPAPVDHRRDTGAGLLLDFRRHDQAQPPLPRLIDDRRREHVRRELIGGCRQAEHLIHRPPRCHHHLIDLPPNRSRHARMMPPPIRLMKLSAWSVLPFG